MSEKDIIFVIFSNEADVVFENLIKKYNLTEDEDIAFDNIQKDINPKEIVFFNLIQDFVLGEISNTQFLDALQQGLGTSKETTKNIALDVVNNLIPLLEKVPEGQLKEYNRKQSEVERKERNQEEEIEEKRKEDIEKTKEELLNKIRGNVNIVQTQEEIPVPNTKKVEVSDVDKNAEKIKEERKPIISNQQEPEKPVAPEPVEKEEDKYKEPLE